MNDEIPAEDTTATARTVSVAEDALLILFDPDSGTFRGEGARLFAVLAGASFIDLALAGRITLDKRGLLRGNEVRVVSDDPPPDPIQRAVWERLRTKPTEVHGRIAEIGPRLRKPLIDRLINRGHLRREKRRILGIIPSVALVGADMSSRAELVRAVRAALVDKVQPEPHVAAVIALLSASQSLPQFYKEIPWSSAIHQRALEIQQGEWGAAAAAEAVTRIAASLVSSAFVTTLIAARQN